MRRTIWPWVVFVAAVAAAHAEPPPVNVDFTVGWGGCFRPTEWTPVEIHVYNKLKEGVACEVTLTAQQDGLSNMSIHHPLVLTPDVPSYLPMTTKIAFGADECTLTVRGADGKLYWHRSYSMWDGSTTGTGIQSIRKDDILVGLVGAKSFGLRQLARANRAQAGKLYVQTKLPKLLPWDWTGYAALDLLVLYNLDWGGLHPEQARAIAEWVRNGGRLLLVLGSRPLPSAGPLAKLLPVRWGQAQQMKVPLRVRRRWGCSDTQTDTVTVWPMTLTGAHGWSTSGYGLGRAVHAGGPVAFGRAAVLAFDPAVLGGRQGDNLARFWRDRLNPLLPGAQIEAGRYRDDPDGYGYGGDDSYYLLGEDSRGANAILTHLMNIPELRPLSIWWVIGLLTVLTLLLGPIDYFVLKRLDRLPWTWVTAVGWIVLFSVGAYFGVQMIRGRKMYVRVVTVQDGIAGPDGAARAGTAWSTVYSGIFAPASDNYRLDGPEGRQWWSGVAPTSGDQLSLYENTAATRRIDCIQVDGGNLPSSLPINIWSMQCMLTESPVSGLPVRATVKKLPDGRIEARITNDADEPIAGGAVRISTNRSMPFGSVPPHETKTFTARPTRGGHRLADYRGLRTDRDSLFNAQAAFAAFGSYRRTRAIESYMANGAAVVYARYNQTPAAFAVAERKNQFHHVQLVRLVVLPR